MTCPHSLKVSAIVNGNVGQALRPSVLGTGPSCRDDSGLSSETPWGLGPKPFLAGHSLLSLSSLPPTFQ